VHQLAEGGTGRGWVSIGFETCWPSETKSQMPTDELQCNAVTGKGRSQLPADELVHCSAVIGKARSQMPTDELQCNCCDW
jgi:hypothetical protein